MEKLAPLVLLVLVVAACGCASEETSNLTSEETSNLKVEDLKVVPKGYGFYTVTGQITPSTDFDYLEIVLKWYDAEGKVVGTDPLAWNTNNAKAGETIKFSASSYVEGGTPAKVDIMISDTPFSGEYEDSTIYKTTINV